MSAESVHYSRSSRHRPDFQPTRNGTPPGAYRAIVLHPNQGNQYLVVWMDHHDRAYEWARRKKVAIHPDTGAIQVYEAIDSTQQQVAPRGAERASGPFDGLRDRQLRRLGVPDELIPLVRNIHTEGELADSEPTRIPHYRGSPTGWNTCAAAYACGTHYAPNYRQLYTTKWKIWLCAGRSTCCGRPAEKSPAGGLRSVCCRQENRTGNAFRRSL